MASTATVQVALPNRKFLPAIQGLRGLAVLPVMGFHLITDFPKLKSIFNYGWIGVDLFFVISGYLITGILLDSLQTQRTKYFFNFYARRVLKIWPLYYALLFFMFVLVPLLRPTEGAFIFIKSHPWQSYLFFVQNFFVKGVGAGPLGLTWSLAIEEQFYLVWPLLVFLIPKKYLGYVLGALVAGTVILRAILFVKGYDPLYLYINPFCRLDGLASGALLALWHRSESYDLKHERTMIIAATCAGILGVAIFGLSNPVSCYLFFSVVFVALVAFATWQNAPKMLSWRPLAFIGTISYGLYLLHVVAYDVLRSTRLGQLGWASAFIMIAFALFLATASWYCFEKPILALKRHF